VHVENIIFYTELLLLQQAKRRKEKILRLFLDEQYDRAAGTTRTVEIFLRVYNIHQLGNLSVASI
jgi:hypothetical protein